MRRETTITIQDTLRRYLGAPVPLSKATGEPQPRWLVGLAAELRHALHEDIKITSAADYIEIKDVDNDDRLVSTRLWFDVPASTLRMGRFIDGQDMAGLPRRNEGAPNREEALCKAIVALMLQGRSDAERAKALDELVGASDAGRADLLAIMLDERLRTGAAPKKRRRRGKRVSS